MENNDRSHFISQLEYYDIVFVIEGEKIIIGNPHTLSDNVDLDHNKITSIPDNVVFVNTGNLWLNRVTHLGENISFLNNGFLNLESLLNLPSSTEFKNNGFIDIRNLPKLNQGTKFENSKGVYLLSIKSDDVPDDTFFLNGGTIAFSNFNTKFLENHSIEAFAVKSIKMGMLMNLMKKRNLLQ